MLTSDYPHLLLCAEQQSIIIIIIIIIDIFYSGLNSKNSKNYRKDYCSGGEIMSMKRKCRYLLPAGPEQQTLLSRPMLEQTDRRTPDRFIDPARQTM